MNNIAVIVTTIKKDKIMMKCLPSFDKCNLTIYLLDQGEATIQKQELYDLLGNKGHHIYCIKKDIGLSAARNFLIDKVTEPYIMIADDDIELISNPLDFLYYFSNPQLGILGGCLIAMGKHKEQHYEYAIEIKNRMLYLKKSDKLDLVLNFFIARKELFNDIRWDKELGMVEHTDFFLRLKQLNKWLIMYDKNLLGYHYSYELRPKEFSAFRSLKFQKYMQIFHRKWNIKGTNRER